MVKNHINILLILSIAAICFGVLPGKGIAQNSKNQLWFNYIGKFRTSTTTAITADLGAYNIINEDGKTRFHIRPTFSKNINKNLAFDIGAFVSATNNYNTTDFFDSYENRLFQSFIYRYTKFTKSELSLRIRYEEIVRRDIHYNFIDYHGRLRLKASYYYRQKLESPFRYLASIETFSEPQYFNEKQLTTLIRFDVGTRYNFSNYFSLGFHYVYEVHSIPGQTNQNLFRIFIRHQII